MSILNEILYRPLFNALVFLVNVVPGHDMGIAIIILTAVIRLLLWPSSAKSIKSQRALQKLQPELDRIKKKYPDKAEQSQKMMAFYKKHKINPFSSCLPLLIQFPILIALYQVFRNILAKPESFSVLYPFISHPGKIDPTFLGLIDLSQPDRFVLPFIAGGLQYVQTWMIMRRRKDQPKPAGIAGMMSTQMMYFMPIMTVIISMSLPAALPLYWAVTTLISIAQQYLIFKDEKPFAFKKPEETPKTGSKTKRSALKLFNRGVKVRVRKRRRR